MNLINFFFLIAFPYLAVATFVIGVIYRRRQKGFTVSSLSSQFLEGKSLFWGTIPFHIGLLVVFLGHLVAFLIPSAVLAWNRIPMRLIILETSAFIFGLTVFIGLVGLMYRRFTNKRVMAVTTKMDIAIELLLLAQIVLGLIIALGYRWGSSWFAADLSPYLWSLVTFSPDTSASSSAVLNMPLPIKLHIIGAFMILFMVPFSRLIHFIVAPFDYIVRPYQQVMWNWDRKKVRDPKNVWTEHRPKNN